MPQKVKEARTRHGKAYFPPSLYDKLQKRAEQNENTVSTEILKIVREALKQEENAATLQEVAQ